MTGKLDDEELAAEIDDALRLRHAIACELGTFFAWQQPRGKRVPLFVPSDRLLEKAGSPRRESEYIAYLEQATQGACDLTFGRPIVDPGDPKPAIPFPQTIARNVQIGKLFAEVAASLAMVGRIEIAGVGTFRRTPADVVTFEAAANLHKAVNAPSPGPR